MWQDVACRQCQAEPLQEAKDNDGLLPSLSESAVSLLVAETNIMGGGLLCSESSLA